MYSAFHVFTIIKELSACDACLVAYYLIVLQVRFAYKRNNIDAYDKTWKDGECSCFMLPKHKINEQWIDLICQLKGNLGLFSWWQPGCFYYKIRWRDQLSKDVGESDWLFWEIVFVEHPNEIVR